MRPACLAPTGPPSAGSGRCPAPPVAAVPTQAQAGEGFLWAAQPDAKTAERREEIDPQLTREYSKRLGTLSAGQLQAALDRFDLGELLGAEPVPAGLFGQNVFLTSTKGEYVLRGFPHHERQFPQERFFTQQIQQRTTVPAPWPYRIEPSPEVFGWSYAMMPRLPGLQIGHPDVREALSAEDRLGLARAMGESLARLHELTWPHAGEYDPKTDTIKPLEVSFRAWVTSRLRKSLQRCLEASDATTDSDIAWAEEQIAQGQDALDAPPEPTFVHHDYKENNAVAERVAGGWQVTGVFDLGEAYFGDGEEDLARSVAGYAAQDPELARQFMEAYRAGRPLRPGFAQRFPIYMLADRLIIWEYGQRNGIWFEPGAILRDWAGRYTSLSLF